MLAAELVQCGGAETDWRESETGEAATVQSYLLSVPPPAQPAPQPLPIRNPSFWGLNGSQTLKDYLWSSRLFACLVFGRPV